MTPATPSGERPRVLALVGTRPEAIKMAPVVRALRDRPEVEATLALSGQHTDLVEQALEIFSLELDQDLEAEHDLALMRPDQDLYDLGVGMLEGLPDLFRSARPDVVLVQGDTATVFFGALVGFFEELRVGHVEAGLRSGDKWAPFPEEILRRLTDTASDFLFAPTADAADNLRREGADDDRVHVTGNSVVDAVRAAAGHPRTPENPALRRILFEKRPLVLLTAHRRESFGEPIREVFRAVREIADTVPEVEILYPVHPNPNVVEPARELLSGHDRIHLEEPLDYLDMVAALRDARLVLTDSGGIQEEAPAFGTPVLVLRDVTERPEGVEAGVARLVGTRRETLTAEARRLLTDEDAHREMSRATNPYGDGRAGERIADIVVSALTGTPRRTEDWAGGDSAPREAAQGPERPRSADR